MHHGPVSPEIAQGLLALRERIEAARIPPSKLDESINVVVWNVREFGKARRSEAALYNTTGAQSALAGMSQVEHI